MFELKIGGLIEAHELTASCWPSRVVRLLGYSGIDKPIPNDDRYLQIDVHDIATGEDGLILPTQQHLQTVLEFTRSLSDDDRLLVHCLAGISRSTAIAIGVCIQHGMTCREAYDHVAEIRPQLQPNTLFIRLIDEHFQLHGQLIELNQYYRYYS